MSELAALECIPWLTLGQAEGQAGGPAPAVGGADNSMRELTGQAPTTPAGAPGGGQPATGSPGGQSPQAGNPFSFMLPLLAVFVVIIVIQIMAGSKEKKRRAHLMASIKRQDRVQTVGGIIGTVVELRDDEVLLKVDEGSNTRIRFARSAIQHVLKSGPEDKTSPPAETLPKVVDARGKAEKATA
jgi:preprotein translocase subunit YajC